MTYEDAVKIFAGALKVAIMMGALDFGRLMCGGIGMELRQTYTEIDFDKAFMEADAFVREMLRARGEKN